MTTPSSPEDVAAALVAGIADDLIVDVEDGFDVIAGVEAARLILTPQAYEALCSHLDVCPMHVCDLDTCADDGRQECIQYRT
jgi:hypothetical protein